MLDLRAGQEIVQRTQLQVNGRMLQSLNILQAPGVELGKMLREEVCKNPFLEERDSRAAGPERLDWSQRQRVDSDRIPGWVVGGNWAEAVAAQPDSWRNRLLTQFRYLSSNKWEVEIAEYLLGSLDERGYLALPPHKIANMTVWSRKQIEQVRQKLMFLDPPGFSALSLKECLMVQLQAMGETDTLACRIVASGLADLASRRFTVLAARLQVSAGAVAVAARRIQRLWPHPASLVDSSEVIPIYPDLRVERIEKSLVVSFNETRNLNLRFNPPPAEIMKQAEPSVLRFVTEHVARARWLLGSLNARRRTLLRVTELIVEEQADFFSRGIRWLKPLGYRHLADLLGFHESTVARAVQDKYVQTPRGTFALRFFFIKALPGSNGRVWTSHGVKCRMRELIQAENSARPLSDDDLTRVLKREGVIVSRRTVAKYRDGMRLPRASYRRKP